MTNGSQQTTPSAQPIYVTLSGLPLLIDLKWPFHRSTSGADFYVLHADLHLVGQDLHALVALNLSVTVREVLPSLDPKDTESAVINALRKEVDRQQLEFLKSGKLVPVHFSSRYWDFRRNRWVFGKGTDEQIATLIARKAYWSGKAGRQDIWAADPTDAMYVDVTSDQLLAAAKKLAADGLVELSGDRARASSKLLSHAATFESDMRSALEQLEQKHAFERG